LTLHTADMMDRYGNKVAKNAIAEIKVVAPSMALKVLDRAIQIHGGGGVTDDFPLARFWAHMRTLRLADGPDEVHRRSIARNEIKKTRGRTGPARFKEAPHERGCSMTNSWFETRPWIATLGEVAQKPYVLEDSTPLADLAATVEVRGDAEAISYYGFTLTWKEFDRWSTAFAAFLAEQGVRPGDRIGIYEQN